MVNYNEKPKYEVQHSKFSSNENNANYKSNSGSKNSMSEKDDKSREAQHTTVNN